MRSSASSSRSSSKLTTHTPIARPLATSGRYAQDPRPVLMVCSQTSGWRSRKSSRLEMKTGARFLSASAAGWPAGSTARSQTASAWER